VTTPYGLLAPAYGWFTEGFDTLDLVEAKALLAELSLTAKGYAFAGRHHERKRSVRWVVLPFGAFL
jgi:hypothetical protein